MLAYLVDAVGCLHDGLDLDAPGELRLVLFAEILGHLVKGRVYDLLVDVELDGNGFKMERQRGVVADGVGERVAAHIAGLVLFGTEGVECVLIGSVDGRAGQAEEEGVRQGEAHFLAEVALLGAVRLINHKDDVLALVERPRDLAEFEDGGDENLSHVLLEEGFKLLFAAGACEVGDVGRVEGARDLGLQINAVVHDDDGWVLELGDHAQLLCGEHHEQRLSGSLEVPDEAALRVAGANAVHDEVRALELLISANQLDAAMLLISGEEREELEDVHDIRGGEHGDHASLNVGQRPLTLLVTFVPGTPHLGRHVD